VFAGEGAGAFGALGGEGFADGTVLHVVAGEELVKFAAGVPDVFADEAAAGAFRELLYSR
jgi:hypothetical protein